FARMNRKAPSSRRTPKRSEGFVFILASGSLFQAKESRWAAQAVRVWIRHVGRFLPGAARAAVKVVGQVGDAFQGVSRAGPRESSGAGAERSRVQGWRGTLGQRTRRIGRG